jgi:hypothetical protein
MEEGCCCFKSASRMLSGTPAAQLNATVHPALSRAAIRADPLFPCTALFSLQVACSWVEDGEQGKLMADLEKKKGLKM